MAKLRKKTQKAKFLSKKMQLMCIKNHQKKKKVIFNVKRHNRSYISNNQ